MPATSAVDNPLKFCIELLACRQATLVYANTALDNEAEEQLDIINKLIDMELKMILSEQYDLYDKYNKEKLRKVMSIVVPPPTNQKEDK